MTFISIVTATYNRATYLPKLLASLEQQSDRDFEWIIVDDGSTDGSRTLCEEWGRLSTLPIRYVYKQNGGKHTALNQGISLAGGELIFFVDSDDTVTADAVATIRETWADCTMPDVCGISFLKMHSDGTVIGDRFPRDGELTTYIDMRINRRVRGDKAEVWRTAMLRQFPFPEIPGEKFLMESAVWGKIGACFPMLHVNRSIYISEYLPDGLTQSGGSLTVRYPVGAVHGVRWAIAPPVRLQVRVVMTWRLIAYGLFARQSLWQIIVQSGYPFQVAANLPFGLALHLYWKFKFRNESSR